MSLAYMFQGVGLSVLYIILAKLGLSFTTVADNVTLIWPPTGLALFVLIAFGIRFWPWIFLGAFIANMSTGIGLLPCVGIAIGNTLEAVTGAYLLRWVNFDWHLLRVRDVLALLGLAAGISTMVSSTIGALSLTVFGVISWHDFTRAWSTWWMGDAMGNLVIAPLLMSWWSRDRLEITHGRVFEASILCLSVIITSQLVFGEQFTLWERPLPLSFITFPFLTWAALRFGMRGASTVVLLIGIVILINIIFHNGPFAQGTTLESLTLLWMYTNFLAITSLLLAAAISERHMAEMGMRRLAQLDHLTGLPNRISLGNRIEQAIHIADRHKNKFALLFLDIDRFKLVNDSLGHPSGDLMLKVISQRLLSCVRKEDTVSRLGGDEFVVLIEDVNRPEDIYTVINKISNTIREPITIKEKDLHASASIGICYYPHDGRDAETLLKNADIAMYRAKDGGRDTFLFYAAEMNTQAEKRLSLENGLRNAIIENEFSLYYQPQFDVNDGKIRSAEALLRWFRSDGSIVNPGDFIPILEETGKIKTVGAWVIEQACSQLARWHASGWKDLRISINLSSHQLNDEKLPNFIADVLNKYHLPADYLELEITESMLVRQDTRTEAVFGKLVNLGVRLAVDDFGTGYSSLSYLHRLSIDTLKIDRSFIENIPGNENSEMIARAIVGLGKSLQLRLIAEGVENSEQLEFVRGLGCDFVQGFLLSRPVSADEFSQLLNTESLDSPTDTARSG